MRNGESSSTSRRESVEDITRWGVWIHLEGVEYFLDYEHFPWFRDATLDQVLDVRYVRRSYLRWPKLDVDLALECLAEPQRFPLVYR